MIRAARRDCILTGVLAFLTALPLTAYLAGARFNRTGSAPLGIYWISSTPVTRGDYVAFCPPESEIFNIAKKRGYIAQGLCESGYGWLLKRVLAAKGDAVLIDSTGVYVNGQKVPHSVPLHADLGGRPLPQLQVDVPVLPDSALLLMSTSSDISFDARYFGLSDDSQVVTVLRPVWTF